MTFVLDLIREGNHTMAYLALVDATCEQLRDAGLPDGALMRAAIKQANA